MRIQNLIVLVSMSSVLASAKVIDPVPVPEPGIGLGVFAAVTGLLLFCKGLLNKSRSGPRV
jgi:hypothetical protein